MPASFKVRTIPLDGDEDATEEVLDPDFGEAAIGRVAPVDSGTVDNGVSCFCFGFSAFPTLIGYLIKNGLYQVYGGSYCLGHMESVQGICQYRRELMSRLE
jgi:hypothetical protein